MTQDDDAARRPVEREFPTDVRGSGAPKADRARRGAETDANEADLAAWEQQVGVSDRTADRTTGRPGVAGAEAMHRMAGASRRAEAQAALEREDHARGYPLSAAFSQLAQSLYSADDVSEVMSRIIDAGTAIVGGDVASITVMDADGRFSTPATSDDLALRLDEAQYDNDDGPCLEATRRGGVGLARSADLAAETSWPGFSRRAVALGVRSVLSIGIFPDTAPPRMGALNFYSRTADGLADADVDVAVILSAHLAAAIAALQEVEAAKAHAAHLSRALEARTVIGQAIGILMERRGLPAAEAFEVLSQASQRLNVKLRTLAGQVADGREDRL